MFANVINATKPQLARSTAPGKPISTLVSTPRPTAPAPAHLRKQPRSHPTAVTASHSRSTLVKVDSVDARAVVATRPISVGDLAAMAAEGQLQLQQDPSNMVYNSRKMASSLVVPVLQGKATPPIVLEVVDGQQQQLRVRDGSQRLQSLLAFVSGSSSVGGQDWPSAPVELDSREGAYIRWNGKRFSQLPETTHAQVAQYSISCVFVRSKDTKVVQQPATTTAAAAAAVHVA